MWDARCGIRGWGVAQTRLELLDALRLVPQVDLPELQQLRLRLRQRRLLLGERRRRLAQPPLEDADGGGRLLRLPPQRRQLGLRLLGLLQRREDARLLVLHVELQLAHRALRLALRPLRRLELRQQRRLALGVAAELALLHRDLLHELTLLRLLLRRRQALQPVELAPQPRRALLRRHERRLLVGEQRFKRLLALGTRGDAGFGGVDADGELGGRRLLLGELGAQQAGAVLGLLQRRRHLRHRARLPGERGGVSENCAELRAPTNCAPTNCAGGAPPRARASGLRRAAPPAPPRRSGS